MFFLSERSLTFNWPLILTKINYYSIEKKRNSNFSFLFYLLKNGRIYILNADEAIIQYLKCYIFINLKKINYI